jgi:iron complex outermembrane receptor protein
MSMAVWWTLVGVLAIAAATTTRAQSGGEIDSVIVWAEKRAAPTQQVPIAMSVLSAEQLSAAGIGDVDGLARQLTALDVQRNAGFNTTSLRIRRVGSIGNIPTFEPAVAVFVDGAFRARSFLGTSNLLAVDHIEVLRGPQTALYGKNVSAGLLGIFTRKPAKQVSVEGELTRGWVDSPKLAELGSVKLDLSGPITSNLGGGVAAEFAQHDHTLVNVLRAGADGDDEDRAAVRGQLLWAPSDSLEFRLLSGYVHEQGDQGESDVFLSPGSASVQVADLLQSLGLTPACGDNVPRNRNLCSVETNKLDLEAEDLTLLVEHSFANGWTIRSTTSADRYEILRIEDDAIQLFAPMLFYHDAEEGRSLQEEVALVSADNTDFVWLVGGFYYQNVYQRGDGGNEPMFGANGDLAYNAVWPAILGGIALAVPGQLGIHDSRLETEYRSVFGQVTWHVTPQWSLAANLRWQEEEKNALINNAVTAPGLSLISAILTPAVTLDGQVVNGALSRTTDNVPWSITPQYRFGDLGMAYFTLAHGSKSGGFNTGFGDAPLAAREFTDETIRHHELGVKLGFANHRVLLNAAAFHTRYENYQDAAFISAQFSVGNAESVDLKGMEFEGLFRLRDRLTLNLSVSRADLRYVKNTQGLCFPGRSPDGSLPNSCVLSGEHPIDAPEWETHTDVQYERPFPWGGLSLRLDWSWNDDYNTSFSADPRLVQDAYSDLALRVGAKIGATHELVLWGENLLDENIVYFDALLNIFNDASYQSYLASPRSYGVTWRVHF